jgi:ABC-type amino acid transport system permease subunit
MRLFSFKKDSGFWFTSLASVCQNLAAAWLGVILVLPKIEIFKTVAGFWVLTSSLVLGIFFLYLSVWFLKRSK